MTHDELPAVLDWLAKLQQNALSVGVDNEPLAARCDAATALLTALSVKLETAKTQLTFLRESRESDLAMIQELDSEQAALSVKLEEAQANYQELHAGYMNVIAGRCGRGHAERQPMCPACHDIVNARGPEASPGEIGKECPSCHTLLLVRGETAQPEVIKACPECGNNTDQRSLSGYVASGAKAWWCDACDHEYDAPAYYQKVMRPQP